MQHGRKNVIVERSIELALMVIEYTDLLESKRRFVFANQILKAGTSIGANVMEAQNGESRADFIHKMKIAAKEADELEFWLLLCNRAPSYPDCPALQLKAEEVNRILSKIIATSKKN